MQTEVPLQVRVPQTSLVQVTEVPAQVDVLVHWSAYVHALPSSQAVPVLGGWTQVPTPLQ